MQAQPHTHTTPQTPVQTSGLKVKTHIKAGFNPQPDPPGVTVPKLDGSSKD
jgi:hypothetical protein